MKHCIFCSVDIPDDSYVCYLCGEYKGIQEGSIVEMGEDDGWRDGTTEEEIAEDDAA
jgi:hypothetical protein